LARRSDELATTEWCRVFVEARALGVVQAHLSGGEPLLRSDLEEITAAAHAQGVYTQLVTSGVGLTRPRMEALREAGLDAVQLSVQAADTSTAGLIAGAAAVPAKRAAAAAVTAVDLPLAINAVLHRHNIDHLDAIVDLALEWGADRLELANVQFYGWALANHSFLLASTAQMRRAHRRFEERRREDGGRLDMVWVRSDYHDRLPKPCMNGWGRTSLTVAPDGRVLPCPAASSISTLPLDSVRERSLRWIWSESPAFTAYRGTAWMSEPCRSCERRHVDFGGCRCQAFALTGDASRTDPVCGLSPDGELIAAAVAAADADLPAGRSLPAARYRGR
jgi:pyrroloquinoline quinone biosynthesis protein E